MEIPIDILEDYPPPPPPPSLSPQGAEPASGPGATSSCAKKCFQRSLTQLTFSLALFSGLSLAMAGLFRERIGNDELDANRIQYKSKKLGLVGLSIVVYAFIGLCVCCSREVYEKYKILCPINLMLSAGTLAYSVLTGESSLEFQSIDAKNGED